MDIHSNSRRHEPLPGNQTLSDQYKQFKALDKIEQSLINRNAQTILNCPVDIRAYYEENGSLEGFKANRIGPKIKTDLLTILTTGIKQALDNKDQAQMLGDTVEYSSPAGLDLKNLELNMRRHERRLRED